jgi:transcriptional regulator with XRE-family HTH domain
LQVNLGIFVPNFSDRLREQREALGMTQAELAEKCGVAARSQRNYESGERSPDAEYMAALAKEGADVLYILTGSRNPAIELRAPPPTTVVLPRRAAHLVAQYLALDDEGQAAVERQAISAAKPKAQVKRA